MSFSEQPVIAIYMATDRDHMEIRRLAALDSAPVPKGRVLLGVVDGMVHAAIDLDTGAVVADPFRLTADLVDLLTLRAQRIRGDENASHEVPTRLFGALRRAARAGDAAVGQPARAA